MTLVWNIGDVTVTRIVESEMAVPYDRKAPFLRQATPETLRSMPWLVPHFVTDEGHLKLSIHALLVEAPGLTLVVDTCIGNDKPRGLTGGVGLQTSFLGNLEAAGCRRESVNAVVCTHLHVDHVGWNTMLQNGRWVPTFPNARYLIGRQEWAHWRADKNAEQQAVLADSVQPIFDARLAELVDMNHRLSSEIHLIPTPGHTPGHVSVVIVEPFVGFKSEKSLIFARNTGGQTSVLPMIQSVQKNNQCDYVVGPVSHPAEKKLKLQIINFLNRINYVGTIAFELFELGSKLVINEVAPRVHNTGHFSQDALTIDQFELHLRCILGLSLPENTAKAEAFVMVNLLGQSTRIPFIKKFPTGSFHWYNKDENRPRRKLGHINYVGTNKKELLKKAIQERKGILL